VTGAIVEGNAQLPARIPSVLFTFDEAVRIVQDEHFGPVFVPSAMLALFSTRAIDSRVPARTIGVPTTTRAIERTVSVSELILHLAVWVARDHDFGWSSESA
jgi:hypothetical protein